MFQSRLEFFVKFSEIFRDKQKISLEFSKSIQAVVLIES